MYTHFLIRDIPNVDFKEVDFVDYLHHINLFVISSIYGDSGETFLEERYYTPVSEDSSDEFIFARLVLSEFATYEFEGKPVKNQSEPDGSQQRKR